MKLFAAVLAVAALGVVGLAGAASAGPPGKDDPVKLNVLFVGAHPDDEAFTIPAFGQWAEDSGLKTGVVTITRGEGGGNAVGPEEGPALGILREGEERRAVGRAGISDIFYLDTVDFYYTVSAPLTEQIWGHDTALEKVVRVIRETKPDVIVTMDPSPSPGNHGNHQYSARLATEAFYAAADRTKFASQLKGEGKLDTWRPARLFRNGASGSGPSGADCASTFVKSEPTDNVFGVWMGTPSVAQGQLWWHILWDAAHEYLSQGFGAFPSPPDLPFIIPCNTFTQIASRVPFDATSTATTAIFQGASVPAPGGLPLGTELYLTSDRFDAAAGQPFKVTAHASTTAGHLKKASVALTLPAGWTATGKGDLGEVNEHEQTAVFTVTPSATANQGRYLIGAALSATVDEHGPPKPVAATGKTNLAVRVDPAVQGLVQRLPQVAQFESWAKATGVPQLGGLVKPVLSIGVGETRSVRVDLHNWSGAAKTGTVALTLPAGFSASPASRAFTALAAGADSSVSFDVTNTNPSLPTANEGGGGSGDYDSQVVTTTGAVSGSETFGLELVPVTTISTVAVPPVVNGIEGPGEYAGPALDLSRLWEGSPCDSAVDCSGSVKVSWSGDAVYLFVRVNDDVLGTRVTPADCKRHWRTDSVEIALDPRGASENTATTFKTGIFPTTNDPAHGNPPCFERDADNHQGDASTAPGMQVASVVTAPYTGYTVEVKIPLADLPAAVDPAHLGLNVFIYDSDTQDLTGQTRLGWSTYGGVQGDPYRWGHATLPGYTPPAGRPTTPSAPVIPQTAALSVDSPQSILQSATDNVPLGAGPAAKKDALRLDPKPKLTSAGLVVSLQAKEAGRAHVFAWTGTASVGDSIVTLGKGKKSTVTLPLSAAARAALLAHGTVLVSFAADAGGTLSLAESIH